MGLMEKKLRGVVSGLGMGWNVPVGCTWKWLKGVHEEDYDITNVKERINIPEDVPWTTKNLVVFISELEPIWGWVEHF